LRDDMVVVGRAMPVLEADDEVARAQTGGGVANSPFGSMLRALDDLSGAKCTFAPVLRGPMRRGESSSP